MDKEKLITKEELKTLLRNLNTRTGKEHVEKLINEIIDTFDEEEWGYGLHVFAGNFRDLFNIVYSRAYNVYIVSESKKRALEYAKNLYKQIMTGCSEEKAQKFAEENADAFRGKF